MKLNLFNYTCKINFIPFIVFIAVLAVLLRLGFWQLARADIKRAYLATQQTQSLMPPVALTELLALGADLRYRQVQLVGRYDVAHQFLVDNQILEGKVGAFVLTPFILAGNNTLVLVNRGWVAMSKGAQQLPDIDFKPASGELVLNGMLNDFPGVGLVLAGADEPSDSWPSVVQIINNAKIASKLNQPIFDFQVQLLADQPNGYTRNWQINRRMPPEKHIAYAVQWFALAITLILLILWISCKKNKDD
ncbi:MAG: SURF1 family protein [Methyloprofundus sp.]|nr:SURF1 family protein [Methyloprofundus sp.]MBW6453051.1 SURF1 family protein [Methyloprofundus sp.]